ncbi:MAG: hypothetical protein JF571_00725 [Asticcacaulis sp.]|nr:hypothetical protein [Asticcacaulis sp.]MBW8882196.1 hypothetical protein [Asticcacaulis sp.]
MYVVEIFLPLRDNAGTAFAASLFETEKARLVERFGGLTAYARAPAQGLWDKDGQPVSDQIVIFEVMTETLDREWWTQYRGDLETRFRQNEILIRASAVDRL